MPVSNTYCAVAKYSLTEFRLTLGLRTHMGKLVNLDFLNDNKDVIPPQSTFAKDIVDQLNRYIKDGKQEFNVALEPSGTAFQLIVWSSLLAIPVGEKLSYGEMAKSLHTGARAIGNACRNNPIPIIIPCHRVVAKSSLGGYGGAIQGKNLELKRWLLSHEHKK